MRNFLLAAAAAILGAGQAAVAQYGPMGGPAGPYPDMMGGGGMGMGGPGGFPGPSPYAPPAFAPASYAGMGGPAPMGPSGPMGPSVMSPSMSPMGGMGGMPPQMAPLGVDAGANGMSSMMQGSSFAGLAGGGGDYCDNCGPGGGGWTNRYFAWGEFLYLRPRNAEVAYAVPVNLAAATAGSFVQAGNVHVAESDYQPAFRAGFGFLLSPRSAIAVSYSAFDRDTFDTLIMNPGGPVVIHSLVNSPSSPTNTAANAFFAAGAQLETRFRILDIDYRGLLVYNPQWQINYVVGARYGNLQQHFLAGFAPNVGLRTQDLRAESEFDGGGLKLGLETLRFHPTTQFFFYGKTYASFLAGQFRARYDLEPNNGVTPPTVTGENIGRLVTMLDLETGLGWQNYTGNFRLSAGYMFQSWLNTVRVSDFINSVQTNNFVTQPASNVNGMVTFDGLVTKVELLW
jgi:hypothetical protein